jgi:hypothetical protein
LEVLAIARRRRCSAAIALRRVVSRASPTMRGLPRPVVAHRLEPSNEAIAVHGGLAPSRCRATLRATA